MEKHQVVMLPTNEKADLRIGKTHGVLHYKNNIFDESLGVYQHLYFLSDEEIKQGDWMFHNLDEKPTQWNGEEINPSVYGYKKIIATTDKSLMIAGKCSCMKPEAGGCYQCNKNLPQPPQEFIKHYVKEYNKGNVITEVWVEYEVDWNSKLTNMEVGFIENNMYTEQEIRDSWYTKLKINSDNTITIQKLKQQFSREEVINLLRLAFDAGKHEAVKMNEWIDENL